MKLTSETMMHAPETPTSVAKAPASSLRNNGAIQQGTGHAIFWTLVNGLVIAHDANIARGLKWIDEASTCADKHYLIGRPLCEILPRELYSELSELAVKMIHAESKRSSTFFVHKEREYALTLFDASGDFTVFGMEIETSQDRMSQEKVTKALLQLSRIMESFSNEAILRKACDTMFHLLEQYEHGMIYRFHDDFSGEIIYEILPPDNFLIDSRLGEAFNGSMIPRQLRESLLKSGAHYIANVYGEDNKVQCKGESMAAFDLSQLQMTAAPKTYIHSLSSLGVVSSVCFAIIVDQRLWGLFVFHNYGCTHQPSLRLRTACESIATTTSVRLEATAEKQKCARLRTLGEAMVNFKATKDTIRNLKDFGEEAVLRILDADLLVAHVQDAKSDEVETCVFGEKALAPTKELFSKLKDYPGRELLVASSTHEIQMQGLSEEASELSGLIYFREGRTQLLIGRANRSHYEWKRLSSESRGTVLKSSCKVWRNEDLLVCTAFKDEICRLAYEHMLLTIQADIEGTEAKYHLAVDRVRENYSFFAHMSHELRTPFHGVMGCLELLTNYSHQIRAMEAKDVIKTAITSGNHMINVLNDTLEFFQHEHFKHKTSRDQVIYQTLVFEAMGCTKSLAASRNVSLKQDLFPKDEKAVIVTDRTKTIQIVSNLVNNAIKFTNNGQVAIKFRLFENSTEAANEMMEASAEYEAFVLTRESHAISACRDEAFKSVASQDSGVNQKWLYFSVTDNGTGISSPDLLRILEPYTQLANAEQSSIRGTGLGLSICVALSHQLGGFLACASTLGVGTTFFVILPVEVGTTNSKADGADDEETASPLSCKNKIPLDGPILLVDDNLVNIKILNRSMQFELKRADRDVELLQATGGAEAIDLFKANRPSLCIIDYHMPEVDGIEATRAIRNFELEHDLEPSHIICYTADVTEEAQTRLLACGMNEIMTKPPPKGFITNLVSRLEDKKKDVETSSSHLMVHAQKYFGLSLGPHHSHPTHRLPVEINL